MAKRVYPQITPEMHREIWLQWLEGVTPHFIVKNFNGVVSPWGVSRTLDSDPPDDFVQDPKFNSRHRYLAYHVDGILNPMTWEPCLYAVVKLPERIWGRQHSKADWRVRDILKGMGDHTFWVSSSRGRIDEELFIEAGEAGMPAFEVDLLGRVVRVEFDFVDRSGLTF